MAISKTSILLFLTLSIIVFVAGGVSAVNCNADLGNCPNGGTIPNSLTLNVTKTIYVNPGQTSTRALIINGHNVIFDCNGSTIVGNTSGIGIRSDDYVNLTIRNCTFMNYTNDFMFIGINNSKIINSRFLLSFNNQVLRSKDVNLSGNYFENYSNQGLQFRGIYNGTIENCVFNSTSEKADNSIKVYDYLGIYSANVTLRNSNVYVWMNSSKIVYFFNNSYSIIKDNNISVMSENYNRYLYVVNLDRESNSSILNNYVNLSGSTNNSVGVYILSSVNSTISNNRIYDGFEGITVRTSSSQIVLNNTILDFEKNIYLVYSNDSVVDGNNIRSIKNTNKLITGLFVQNTTVTTFKNNVLRNADRGVHFKYSDHSTLENNTYWNMTQNDDYYDVPIFIYHSVNVTINKETINESVGGILIQNSTVRISNVTADLINFSERYKYRAMDLSDPMCFIMVKTLYKTYLGDNLESLGSISYDYIKGWEGSTVNITNSSCDVNDGCQCYLHTEGNVNLIQDFTNYYRKSFRFEQIGGRNDIYLPNNVKGLYKYSNGSGDDVWNGYGLSSVLIYGYAYGWSDKQFKIANMTFNNTYDYFKNINGSINVNLTVYNRTKSLIYLTNGTVICTNIPTCTGDFNITLPPGNATYVLDNYNVTEGVSRENSPITVTAPSKTSKTLSSTLTDSVNTDVYLTLDNYYTCDYVKSVSVGGSAVTHTCEDNLITIESTTLAAGVNTVSFLITSQSQAVCAYSFAGMEVMSSSFPAILSLFGLLILLSFLGGIIYVIKNEREGNMINPGVIVGFGMGIAVLVVVMIVFIFVNAITCSMTP